MSIAEWFRYAAITFGLVVIAIVLSGLLARWFLVRALRERFARLSRPSPWWTYKRPGWWARARMWWNGPRNWFRSRSVGIGCWLFAVLIWAHIIYRWLAQ